MQQEQTKHTCSECGQPVPEPEPPVTVIIPTSIEKQILERMIAVGDGSRSRVVVRLLEEDSPNGCAWYGEVYGWENPQ